MSRVVLIASSLGGGGAERQAVILFEQLRKTRSCLLVSLEDDLSYLSSSAEGVLSLSKSGRFDFLRLVVELRRILRPEDVVVAFNWYPNVLGALARPRAPRIVRYGAPVLRDVPAGARGVLARIAHRSAAASVGLTWGMAQDAELSLGSPRVLCSAIPNAVVAPASGSMVRDREYLAVLSRLEPEKGVDRVVRAFAHMAPDVTHDLRIGGSRLTA